MLGLVIQNLCLLAFIARLDWQNEANMVYKLVHFLCSCFHANLSCFVIIHSCMNYLTLNIESYSHSAFERNLHLLFRLTAVNCIEHRRVLKLSFSKENSFSGDSECT